VKRVVADESGGVSACLIGDPAAASNPQFSVFGFKFSVKAG